MASLEIITGLVSSEMGNRIAETGIAHYIIGLYQKTFGVIHNKYLMSLIILVLFYIFSELVLWITEKIIIKFTAKTQTDIDDKIIQVCKKPASLIMIIIGVKLALVPLNFQGALADILSKLTTSIILFIFVIIIIRVADILIEAWGKRLAVRTKSSIDDAILPLFHKVSKVTIFIIGIMIILSLWGINVTGIAAGLGVAGIAVGFALKDSLANIFGGISLIMDRALKVGDIIKLDSGEEGTIIDIGLRSTKLKTRDNELILVPNGILSNTKVHNYKLPDLSARVIVPFSVAYGCDTGKVKKVILAAINKMEGVAKEPVPEVRFELMGEFSLNFKLYFWISNVEERGQKRVEATELVYNALNKNNIEIPFPTHTVYLKK